MQTGLQAPKNHFFDPSLVILDVLPPKSSLCEREGAHLGVSRKTFSS